MKNEIKFKSKVNESSLLIYLIGIVIGVIVIIINLNSISYPGILIGSLLFLLGVFGVLTVDIVEITKKDLIIKSIYGKIKKVITLSSIESYSEIQRRNKYYKWEDLILLTKEDKYVIHSSNYKNYNQLKTYVIEDVKRDIKPRKEWERKNELYIGIGLISTGVLLTYFFLVKNKEAYDTLDYLAVFISIFFSFVLGFLFVLKKKK